MISSEESPKKLSKSRLTPKTTFQKKKLTDPAENLEMKMVIESLEEKMAKEDLEEKTEIDHQEEKMEKENPEEKEMTDQKWNGLRLAPLNPDKMALTSLLKY